MLSANILLGVLIWMGTTPTAWKAASLCWPTSGMWSGWCDTGRKSKKMPASKALSLRRANRCRWGAQGPDRDGGSRAFLRVVRRPSLGGVGGSGGEAGTAEAVIGTTISGIGTSLPELTIALLSVKKSEGVAIGTLVGSNITDPTLSIGLAALVHPWGIPSRLNSSRLD